MGLCSHVTEARVSRRCASSRGTPGMKPPAGRSAGAGVAHLRGGHLAGNPPGSARLQAFSAPPAQGPSTGQRAARQGYACRWMEVSVALWTYTLKNLQGWCARITPGRSAACSLERWLAGLPRLEGDRASLSAHAKRGKGFAKRCGGSARYRVRRVGRVAEKGEGRMRGVITGREVVANLGLIYREFGAGCVLRCLWVMLSGKTTTFLEVACPPEVKR